MYLYLLAFGEFKLPAPPNQALSIRSLVPVHPEIPDDTAETTQNPNRGSAGPLLRLLAEYSQSKPTLECLEQGFDLPATLSELPDTCITRGWFVIAHRCSRSRLYLLAGSQIQYTHKSSSDGQTVRR